jgi:membrane protease YdiL (CAAX protease family)
VKSSAAGDVLKVWVYAGASVLLGAWWCPVFFQGGKALAEVAARKQTNQPLDWLARWCTETEFPGFFSIGLLLAALVLWLPFTEWLRLGRKGADGENSRPWGIRLLPRSLVSEQGQILRKHPLAMLFGATGFLLTAGLFLLLGNFLLHAGSFQWSRPIDGWTWLLIRAGLIAAALATVQELLFRGVAMGIFLRAMRPAAAMALSAVLFAGMRYLAPAPDLTLADPEAGGLGFEFLSKIAVRIADPWVISTTVLPLLLWGILLGYARWRTSSLWLPVGLHGGWIFSRQILDHLAIANSRKEWMPQAAETALQAQGLMSIAGILIASVVVYFLTQHEKSNPHATA